MNSSRFATTVAPATTHASITHLCPMSRLNSRWKNAVEMRAAEATAIPRAATPATPGRRGTHQQHEGTAGSGDISVTQPLQIFTQEG